MAVTMTGKTGVVLVHGREAAHLSGWELSAERGRVVIRATLHDVNMFRLENSESFDVLLDVGAGTRVYRDMLAQVTGEQATFIRVGEEKHG